MARILCIAGPTASGKSKRAVAEALARNGEIISVDSRQVYRTLDIGTEKISEKEMCGVPHYLLNIREPVERYSAGDFVLDARRLISEISQRGKLPILAGGTHFYFDALLSGLPLVPVNEVFRNELAEVPTEALYARLLASDAERAAELDPKNRRRLIRALEIINMHGRTPKRAKNSEYTADWIIIDPPSDKLRENINARLASALERGLIEEVEKVREKVGDERLNEFGLEYRTVGEYLRGERDNKSLLPALSARLWQYARRQKAWLRKLKTEHKISSAV